MHPLGLPRLDGDGVKPRQQPEARGKVLKYRICVQMPLVVVAALHQLLGGCQLIECRLVRHKHPSCHTPRTAFLHQLRPSD